MDRIRKTIRETSIQGMNSYFWTNNWWYWKICGAYNSMLHETNPVQFGFKILAEYILWPHIYRKIYHNGKSCNQCSKAGKYFKFLLSSEHTDKLLDILFEIEEINKDFEGPKNIFCVAMKYVLLCINRFTKLSSAKDVINTSSNTVSSVLNKFCYLHGFSHKS